MRGLAIVLTSTLMAGAAIADEATERLLTPAVYFALKQELDQRGKQLEKMRTIIKQQLKEANLQKFEKFLQLFLVSQLFTFFTKYENM